MYGKFNGDDNDISRVFAQKVEKQYNKDFGRFPRSNQKESNDVKTNELTIRLIEAEEKIASLNRALENKDHEIEKLNKAVKTSSDKVNEVVAQSNSYKSELERIRRASSDFGQGKIRERLLLDDYRTALSKFMTWFNYSEKQMEVMKNFFQECGGWSEENRYKIYFAYKEVEPITVKDEDLPELCKGSVFDYQGIEDIGNVSEFEQRLKFHSISTQTDVMDNTENLESGFIHDSDGGSSHFGSQPQHSNMISAEEFRSLGHIEKIQGLESENVGLKNQLMILSEKARHNALLEEQKFDLQQQLDFLRSQNNQVIEEHEKLKDRMSIGQGSSSTDYQAKLADATEKNRELEQKLKDLETQKPTAIAVTEESKKIAQFFKQKYQSEIDELKSKLAEYQPLHASETTRIVRFQGFNPLDEAYEDHVVNQAAQAAASSNTSKRRKLDSSTSADDYSGASGNNIGEDESELINGLRRQLKRVNKEYETSVNLQKELALQYRQIITLLTGYQVKMREEGFLEVNNVLDQAGSAFLFQRREDNGVDLLDNECAQRWKSVVSSYLAKYNSVPAFLSAVNLALIENDASSVGNTLFDMTKP